MTYFLSLGNGRTDPEHHSQGVQGLHCPGNILHSKFISNKLDRFHLLLIVTMGQMSPTCYVLAAFLPTKYKALLVDGEECWELKLGIN